MRRLTSKQKNYIDELANDYFVKSEGSFMLYLDAGHIKDLEDMNDYETLWQDAMRELNDHNARIEQELRARYYKRSEV